MLKLLIAVALAYFSFVLIQQYLVKRDKPVALIRNEIEEINQKIGAVDFKKIDVKAKPKINSKTKQAQTEIPIEYLVRPLVLEIEDYYLDADEDFFRAVYSNSSIKSVKGEDSDG